FRARRRATTGSHTLPLHDALPISGHHDGICRLDNSIDIVNGLRLFDLCYDQRMASFSFNDLLTLHNILCRAYERHRYPICAVVRSEEHTSELQSREKLVCRLLLE